MSDLEGSVANFVFGEDELGEFARVSIDTNVYGMLATLKATYWFTDFCYLYLVSQGTTIQAEFRPKVRTEESLETLKSLCGGFFNTLLDHSVRLKVLEETAGIRDSLLKKAFFDASLSIKNYLALNRT